MNLKQLNLFLMNNNQLHIPQIQMVNNTGRNRSFKNEITVHISKWNLTVHFDICDRIKLLPGDFLIIGMLGAHVYIAKKPEGVFGGSRAWMPKGKKIQRLGVSIPKGVIIPCGSYKLGTEVLQTVKTEQGTDTSIRYFELIKL
jgi:hypothetical protein